ncbi:cAMP-dependent protein kinase inhibitor gamma isoform X2 [Scophthalmus maximus]|uniref:cAMP-dependent protein kinase inhibitor gamma isoform X2 n=1 Tax=Scophthalmus maximus TaxID=52904 RepID=UPI001FA90B28|nr:cAMP-dependent protein kinase inhibitor gamma isoform X2 [Scophthalmus maximus]
MVYLSVRRTLGFGYICKVSQTAELHFYPLHRSAVKPFPTMTGVRESVRGETNGSQLPERGQRCNESAGHGQMMDVETSYSDFINCDRTGRRNAVPDIAGEGKAGASTSELTKDLAEMDLKAAGGDPGASPAPAAEGSTSQDAQGSGGPS